MNGLWHNCFSSFDGSSVAIAALLTANAAAQTPELRWGGDAEGGAPFVEADPADPTRVVGFEVDIAAMLAEGLNRTPRFIQTGFTTIDASVARGDFAAVELGTATPGTHVLHANVPVGGRAVALRLGYPPIAAFLAGHRESGTTLSVSNASRGVLTLRAPSA